MRFTIAANQPTKSHASSRDPSWPRGAHARHHEQAFTAAAARTSNLPLRSKPTEDTCQSSDSNESLEKFSPHGIANRHLGNDKRLPRDAATTDRLCSDYRLPIASTESIACDRKPGAPKSTCHVQRCDQPKESAGSKVRPRFSFTLGHHFKGTLRLGITGLPDAAGNGEALA